MRIAKGDYFDPPVTPKTFSANDYDILVTMLKNRLVNWLGNDDVSDDFPIDEWEAFFLVKSGWASAKHATGTDFRRGFQQACDELVDTGLYRVGEAFPEPEEPE